MTKGWDTLNKETVDVPGGMEQDSTRFHHATQNGAQFKTYELLISEIFHLMFSDCGWLQVTETAESETADKGEPLQSR